MLYLANPCSPAVIHAMRHGLLGYLDTPAQGNLRPPGVTWAADNGCFGAGYPGDAAWLAWLRRHRADAGRCLFAAAPDVVGDAAATLARSWPFLPAVRDLDYPVALVAQNGLEHLIVPWDEFDVLFVGGTTSWKLGPAAAALVAEAVALGKRVHMGRVNSRRRLRYANEIGCRSVDGTYLTFGPDTNLPKLLTWIRSLNEAAPGQPGQSRLRPSSGTATHIITPRGRRIRERSRIGRGVAVRPFPSTRGQPTPTAGQP